MMTISVGVALTSDYPERDLDEIIHAADVALYAAKAAGRNCVRVAQSLPKSFSQKVRC
jgi:diguanylate cyclase